MTARRAVWEVARRELVERSRSRAWRVTFVLLLILSVGGAIAAARVSSGTPNDDVGLVGARSIALQPAIGLQAQAAGRRVRLHRLASTAAASRALRDGAIDVALLDGNRLLVKGSRTAPAVRVVQDAVGARAVLDRLRNSGLSEAQALRALVPRALPVQVLEPSGPARERNRDLLYVGLLVLYIALVGFGNAVATSVTEEKSSRVVELLLTTLPPRRLLAGKVLGVGLLGLAQLLLAGGAALAAGQLAGGAGLPSAGSEAIGLVLLWFVLGYALYSVAYAALGALVSRQEDLSGATTLLTTALIGSFVLAMIALDNPNGTPASVAAFVPPFAPMVVPARVVLGDMSALGLIGSVAVDLLATAGLILLAARVYERAILRIGAPVKLRRVLTSRTRRAQPSDLATAGARLTAPVDLALGWAATALILAGAVILITRLSEPLAIALIAVGLLLKALRERGKRGPHNAAR